jgi:hypothetical protein
VLFGRKSLVGKEGEERWVDARIRAMMEDIQAIEDGTLGLARARTLERHRQLQYRTAELAMEVTREGMGNFLIDVELDEEDLARLKNLLRELGEAIRRKMKSSFGPS